MDQDERQRADCEGTVMGVRVGWCRLTTARTTAITMAESAAIVATSSAREAGTRSAAKGERRLEVV